MNEVIYVTCAANTAQWIKYAGIGEFSLQPFSNSKETFQSLLQKKLLTE